MKAAVLVFPGSNCDRDARRAIAASGRFAADLVSHRQSDLSGYDLVVLPGGFAHGDYLRAGSIARFSPCMRAVAEAASAGVPVLGICNGFQILLESGLLPGAMLTNINTHFRHSWINVSCPNPATAFSQAIAPDRVLRLIIAHGQGNYFADSELLARLEGEGQIVFRYCAPDGRADAQSNPNGSLNNIAGVCNRTRNVVGLMPHPERASDVALGSDDGISIWQSAAEWLVRGNS